MAISKEAANAGQKAADILMQMLSGGAIGGQVDIKRDGDTIVLPPGMSYDEGIIWLQRKKTEEETFVKIDETITGFAYDAANAFNMAVLDMFGMKAMDSWRNGSQNVPVNAKGDTINVYLGDMSVPGLEGNIGISVLDMDTVNIHFYIRQRDRDKADRLMVLARQYVKTRSIYRGKAFLLKWKPATMFAKGGFADPEFIPAEMRGQLQVNAETRQLVQATVWTPIQHAERCRELKIPLKRGILLEGPYGTGKTLFSAETATVAVENGWTFLYLKDIRYLALAYQAARNYAPSVLFAEDVDLLMTQGAEDIPEAVRNTLDGIDTKTAEVIVVLTTNWLERLPKSILRPGRLDAVIPFRAPDRVTADKLIRQYAGELLPATEDLSKAASAVAGQIPATIREVVERSKLHALSHNPDDLVLTGDDLSMAAEGMKHHLAALNREREEGPSVMEQFGESFGKGLVLAASAAKNGISVEAILDSKYAEDLPLMEREVLAPTVANGRR